MADDTAEETLGDRLRGLRQAAEKTQEEVAHDVGCNSGTYSRWERGVGKPHADEIVGLAQYFGCTTDYLLLGGTVTKEETSRELHRFSATKLGRYAQKRKLVSMLRAIRVGPDGRPPTVKTYERIVKTYRVLEDVEDDDALDEDPPKSARKID